MKVGKEKGKTWLWNYSTFPTIIIFLPEHSKRKTVPYLEVIMMIMLMKCESIFEFYHVFLRILDKFIFSKK
jgi:hypothetical protein